MLQALAWKFVTGTFLCRWAADILLQFATNQRSQLPITYGRLAFEVHLIVHLAIQKFGVKLEQLFDREGCRAVCLVRLIN